MGLPSYYAWRTRSGCFFGFSQLKYPWVRLVDEHPDLFVKAVACVDNVNYEDKAMKGRQFTWQQGESLRELIGRRDEITRQHEKDLAREKRAAPKRPLAGVLGDVLDAEDGHGALSDVPGLARLSPLCSQ